MSEIQTAFDITDVPAHATTHESGGSDLLTMPEVLRVQAADKQVDTNYSVMVVGPYTINSGKKLTIGSGGRFKIDQGASLSKPTMSVSGSNGGVSSITYRMYGIANRGSNIIAPISSGIIFVSISGYGFLGNTTDSGSIQMQYGTGTPPAFNTPIVGTTAGLAMVIAASSIAFGDVPFNLSQIITGLSLNVPYWVDPAFLCLNGTTSFTLSNVTVMAFEL